MFDRSLLTRDLRVALALKADDVRFTVGGRSGQELQASFLGVATFDGLAIDTYCDESDERIDLSRFQIAEQFDALAAIVENVRWGPRGDIPDTEAWRHEVLDFVEHFLSTIPTVSLGGLDATQVRNGPLKSLFQAASAWLDLVDAVASVFEENGDFYTLELSQLALLSGRDLRTIRNLSGPSRQLRTTPDRVSRGKRELRSQAFVGVNTFDAIDWLQRKRFGLRPLNSGWAQRRFDRLADENAAARALLMFGLINTGPADQLANRLGWDERKLRSIACTEIRLSKPELTQLRDAVGLTTTK